MDERAATIMRPNTGLLLRARNACVDRSGVRRQAGEEWLHIGKGSYLPSVHEEILSIVQGKTLTETTALHLEAIRNFTDLFEKNRKAGEQWMVSSDSTENYIPGPHEKFLGLVDRVVLTPSQFCVVLDPWRDGKQMLGQREIRRGQCSFFLHPGESLECGIQDVFILTTEEALLMTANEAFKDEDFDVDRKPGDRWMIYGPKEYVPKVEVSVLERRRSIPLDENEGIYVRDTKSGHVRAVIGGTYMLAPDEELWAKDVPQLVLEKISAQSNPKDWMEKRRAAPLPIDMTRVVAYNVPHNSIVQVYDYKSKKTRIVFGPNLVMLGPDEQFTIIRLSGGKPKRPNVISTVFLGLGPDFMTDIVTVETSDHARLSLQLSYNWFFDCKAGDVVDGAKVFNVPDFVGDVCNAIASRIRGAVASESFDMFHKNSSSIIRAAVFGINRETNEIRDRLTFPSNGLVITSVDIQSVEPVDTKTRDALMKSVQLAIEITTKSQEAAARHDAERGEQEAKGKLERQIIDDKAKAEKERFNLLALQAESAAIESTGASKAEAKAQAAAVQIVGESEVKQAQFKAQAQNIAMEAELLAQQSKQHAELEFKQQLNTIEVGKMKQLAEIEVDKFQKSVHAIGKETIAAMARAGPEMQAKLLKGLGLEGYFLTDGNSPINLMNAAKNMTGSTV
eukprot:NODE_382_length_2328_cov_31.077666_g355_i0.p1 GENE.NODE_382_length_2328_cov_31.077666_g355_i0~~NODE_382_length_2328_cov_31.077666_g355_i0.p1  ORF type:complete len:761 (+),score=158.72 NODE_382_length_2328_cov_31.077666_g355_i0:253-2283(+)